jgi:hypothetical protein
MHALIILVGMEVLVKYLVIHSLVFVLNFILETLVKHVNYFKFKLGFFIFSLKFKNILDSNVCSSSPCLNGATCQLSGNSFICNCMAGYSGPYCQTCNKNE